MVLSLAQPSVWSLAPLGLLLVTMAAGPVLAPVWWQRRQAPVALGLGAVTVALCLSTAEGRMAEMTALVDYVSFITLIGGLFVIAGGLRLTVPGPATTGRATLFLLAGAWLANVLGTTGAAMLLLRPWLQWLGPRARSYHVVFFIFLVANVGGGLTPLGDPPLLLAWLKGMPFWWIARHGWPLWGTTVGLLALLFYLLDRWFAPEPRPVPAGTPHQTKSPAGGAFQGATNLVFLAIILGTLALPINPWARAALMVAATAGSYWTTPPAIRTANDFHWHPLLEIGVLFAGLFATLPPALAWLSANAGAVLGPHPTAGSLYWSAGVCSSVLDNAPAWLAFYTALGALDAPGATAGLWDRQPAAVLALSLASVFFGAATYIGNGPNLLVKAVAEEAGIPMPGFLGLLGKYSLPGLLPVLAVVWWVFLRGR